MKPVLLLLLLFYAWPALAHKPSDSYLGLNWTGSHVQGQWDIALRDLDYAMGLDADNDGVITWGELRQQRATLNAYALARLHLSADNAECSLQADDLLVDEHSDGHYAVLRFTASCPHEPQQLAITYSLFFELDPQHRGLLKLEHDGQTDSHLFGPSSARYELTHHAPQATSQVLYNFVREGIWHIWIGYDHILFLLSLLLPAALRRIEGRWQSGVNFRHAAWDVAKIVTAFTLAHSITLSLAALGYLALPSRWVESAIAASVVVAALNNLGGWIVSRRAGLAFAFGLVHGLGFAAVLLDLGLPKSLQLIGLVGFNIGVELGQLSIVAVVLPLITVLSRFEYYAPILLKFGSSCIAAVALVWLAERSIGFSLGLF